ncbi:cupin domain-containing protein [Pedobacter sp.]|uniref:cupin domain-containing protein n=1 Tax=Pedobacter sp. TaxID=1411316 RepID=UPI003D7F632B
MDSMTTVSEVLRDLKTQGYTVDFNLENNCLVCSENRLKIHPEEFVLDKHFRFEGMSDPGDEAVVYAISSPKHHLKGVLVNGYGIYSDPETDQIVKTLEERARHFPAENTTSQVKFNEATPLRPEGDRMLDAPLVQMDLNAFKKQIKEEEAWKTGDRNAITIFKNDHLRIVLIGLHNGTEMKPHTAKGMISVQVLEGKISFRTAMDTAELGVGQMIVLHPDILHSVYAHEESVFLLTMATT